MDDVGFYDQQANSWWDPDGFLHGMGTLLNPVRLPYLEGVLTASGQSSDATVLDLGCGGGLMAEGLADLGLAVTAIDRSLASVAAGNARGGSVRYVAGDVLHLPFADGAFDVDQIGLGDAETRMSEPLGEVSVVRQEQQALAVHVETTNRIHPGLSRHGPNDGGTLLRIRRGTHHSYRLVEQVVDQLRVHRQRNPIDGHSGRHSVDLLAQMGRTSVYCDAALTNQILCRPSRGNAGVGDEFLQSLYDSPSPEPFAAPWGRNGRSRASTTCAGGT